MQYKGLGIFLALSLISAGFLVNCRSNPESPPAARQPQGQARPPAPESPAGPARQDPAPEIPSLRLLTKKTLDRAYNRDHLDPKKFQYFLSETMEMERGLNSSTLSLNARGELFQEDSLTHERIIFEKETMGIAADIRIGKDYEHWEIDIRFDPADDRILTFRENDEGSSFDLFYVQIKTEKKIPYGKEEYNLNFADTPRLLIKMAETSKDLPVLTTVEGIAVDSLSPAPPPAP
jgi:hypothetical protein